MFVPLPVVLDAQARCSCFAAGWRIVMADPDFHMVRQGKEPAPGAEEVFCATPGKINASRAKVGGKDRITNKDII